MGMKVLNKISVLIFLLSSSFVFAKDIEIGDFLTEEQLLKLKPYHRSLDYYFVNF